ncbi:MAG: hypothetical protein WCQ76_05740 [Fusobacterium sp.]
MGILSRSLQQIKKEEGKIRSIDLVKQINIFREREGSNPNKRHDHFVRNIKEYNKVADKLGVPKIGETSYIDRWNRKQKCYLLSEIQSKMFMAKESYAVQIMVEKEFESLLLEVALSRESINHTKITLDALKEIIEELGFDKNKYARFNKEINDLVGLKFNKTNLKKDDMNTNELEFRAEVEEVYVESLRKSKKHGGTKAKVKKLLFK